MASPLGRGKPGNLEGDLVGTVVYLEWLVTELGLTEADERVVDDLGPAGAPGVAGHVLPWMHLSGNGDEVVVG